MSESVEATDFRFLSSDDLPPMRCLNLTLRVIQFGSRSHRSNWTGWPRKPKSPASSWAADLRTVSRN